MDQNFSDYRQQVEASLTVDGLRESIRNIRPLGLFSQDSQGEWLPRHHAGYTLITPAFADEAENLATFVRLGDVQQLICRKLDPARYVPAPISAFHQTVARLVSGSDFDEKMQGTREADFLHQITKEFAQFPPFAPIKMEIKGVGVIAGGIIAALINTTNEVEYQRLLSFRTQLYSNKNLQSFGVEPKRPFVGHVTLAYLEAAISPENQLSLWEIIKEINRRFFTTSVSFKISRAEVRKFDNYLKFYREPDWPRYQFS